MLTIGFLERSVSLLRNNLLEASQHACKGVSADRIGICLAKIIEFGVKACSGLEQYSELDKDLATVNDGAEQAERRIATAPGNDSDEPKNFLLRTLLKMQLHHVRLFIRALRLTLTDNDDVDKIAAISGDAVLLSLDQQAAEAECYLDDNQTKAPIIKAEPDLHELLPVVTEPATSLPNNIPETSAAITPADKCSSPDPFFPLSKGVEPEHESSPEIIEVMPRQTVAVDKKVFRGIKSCTPARRTRGSVELIPVSPPSSTRTSITSIGWSSGVTPARLTRSNPLKNKITVDMTLPSDHEADAADDITDSDEWGTPSPPRPPKRRRTAGNFTYRQSSLSSSTTSTSEMANVREAKGPSRITRSRKNVTVNSKRASPRNSVRSVYSPESNTGCKLRRSKREVAARLQSSGALRDMSSEDEAGTHEKSKKTRMSPPSPTKKSSVPKTSAGRRRRLPSSDRASEVSVEVGSGL